MDFVDGSESRYKDSWSTPSKKAVAFESWFESINSALAF